MERVFLTLTKPKRILTSEQNSTLTSEEKIFNLQIGTE